MTSTDLKTRFANTTTELNQAAYQRHKVLMSNRNTQGQLYVECGPKWLTILEDDANLIHIGDILFSPVKGRFKVIDIRDPEFGLVIVGFEFMSLMEPYRSRRFDLTSDCA